MFCMHAQLKLFLYIWLIKGKGCVDLLYIGYFCDTSNKRVFEMINSLVLVKEEINHDLVITNGLRKQILL